jgi:hypothetical protein
MRRRDYIALGVVLAIILAAGIEIVTVGPPVASASRPAHIATLPTPDNQAYGDFGQSVATSPGGIIVVGAGNETVGGYIGAGNVYTYSSNIRTLDRTFTSPNAQTNGHFGQSVAISAGGKNNRNPTNSIVVGAPGETVNGTVGAGRAYVFNTTTGNLISTLVSPNSENGGGFGWSVTASGTVVVVGAPGETVNGIVGAGRAYVFNAITGGLIKTLTSQKDKQTDGYFGQSVGMSDNKVRKGADIVVGAPGETVNGHVGAGEVYVFSTKTGDLEATLSSPNPQSDGYFGWSVSLTLGIVAVGAPKETSNGFSSAGNAYLFTLNSAALVCNLSSPNPQSDGYFGWSVWLSEYTVGVGAPGETVNGFAGAGHAYTFSDQSHFYKTGALIKVYASPDAQANGAFGSSITVVQGPNERRTGYIVVVAAPDEDVSGYVSSGNAYV